IFAFHSWPQWEIASEFCLFLFCLCFALYKWYNVNIIMKHREIREIKKKLKPKETETSSAKSNSSGLC
ncbi:hypothetical protein ACQP3D_30280, partial [Escherichia coli]